MQEILKRDLSKTYLILSGDDETYEESYETEMIVKNELETLLPLHILRVDGNCQMFYDVSAKQTLKECAQRVKLTAETIRSLFETIERLEKEVNDYLLDFESVILDLNHIYTKEGRFYFCYCPWEKQEVLASFRGMLEEILGDIDYHDTQGVELAYHLYQNACRGEFSIGEILKEHCKDEKLTEKNSFREEKIVWEEDAFEEEPFDKTEWMDLQEKPKKESFIKKLIKFFLKKEIHEVEEKKETYFHEMNSERTVTQLLKKADTGTVLLQDMPVGKWKLRPLHPGYEEFCVEGDSFLVGKKRDSVDGFIGRDTISRIHSRLFIKENRLFVSDANSTNGTFVNGIALEPGEDVEIFPGDRILFADVGYECYNSL